MRDLRRFVDEVSENSSIYHVKITDFTCKEKLSFSNICLLISSLLKNVYLNNLELVYDKNPPRGSNKLGKWERNSTERNYKRVI